VVSVSSISIFGLFLKTYIIIEMSTPVLVDPLTGEVVIDMKSGPAVGKYRADTLEGERGAFTLFKHALNSKTGNVARTAATLKQDEVAQKYFSKKIEQANLAGELATAKMLKKSPEEIARITAAIAAARSNKKTAKGSEWNAAVKQKKISCGWTPGWLPGSLVAPKITKPGCETIKGGTRKRKLARRSNTGKNRK
jgi:hypothetical protein